MDTLCIICCRGFTRTDCPDWFVSDDRAVQCFNAVSIDHCVDLASTYRFCFARFVLRFSFTDTEDWR
ncbi:Uncharacterised protein [Vibrio cholerae]|uniref:Uncharacterized protein n=1 Tax=Vibrio cholerae TaxID=666 RepID=A0A655X008_VIBCL|nr:Uncharacterised protein [Vibrio cholerae]CSB00607.1 Uncharacterised protein [Vibrio cholerae]CSB93485.1 Uncharacterised protein [Vibrio cholerae]CSC01980.1 Uncharacterised protein [Vibrio cholerae]